MLKFSSTFRRIPEEPLGGNYGHSELGFKSTVLNALPLIHQKNSLPF